MASTTAAAAAFMNDNQKRPSEDDDGGGRESDNDNNNAVPYRLKSPRSLTKRQRLESSSSSLPLSMSVRNKVTPSHFLPFHYRMLRSLYEDGNGNDSYDAHNARGHDDEAKSPGTKTNNNNDPDDTIWQSMENFLKDRCKILQTQKDAKESQGVHQAALAFLHHQSTSSSSAVDHRWGDSPDPIFRRRSHEQATHHSPSILQSPLQKSLHTSFTNMAGASQTTGQRQSFRLVSHLLQKRAQTIRMQYQEQSTQPYAKLRLFVKEQLTALTDESQRLKEALGRSSRSLRQQLLESPRTPPKASHQSKSEEQRSALAAMEAKARLFKLLDQDLEETIIISSAE